GRVPTPRGYRMFVDSLLAVQPFEFQPQQFSEASLSAAEPSRAVTAAAVMLSNLTQFAGVVLTPKRAQVFRQIEFIRLSEKRVLLIIVTPDGDVQNRILSVQRDYSESELIEAANFFNVHFAGKSFDAVRRTLTTELAQLREDISRLMQAAVEAGAEAVEDGDGVVISGERKLLDVTDIASDMDRLRKMFALFEQKTDLLQLLDVSSRAQGVQIYIGGESQLLPLEEISVSPARDGVDGRVIGTLRVLGPPRMAYARAIPIVDTTARLRSNAFSNNQWFSNGPAFFRSAPQRGILCFYACSSICGPSATCPNRSRRTLSTITPCRGRRRASGSCWSTWARPRPRPRATSGAIWPLSCPTRASSKYPAIYGCPSCTAWCWC